MRALFSQHTASTIAAASQSGERFALSAYAQADQILRDHYPQMLQPTASTVPVAAVAPPMIPADGYVVQGAFAQPHVQQAVCVQPGTQQAAYAAQQAVYAQPVMEGVPPLAQPVASQPPVAMATPAQPVSAQPPLTAQYPGSGPVVMGRPVA